MPDSSDLDYNPNNKNDIDDRRKKCSKRKKRNAGGRNTAPKLTIYQCSLCSYRTGLRTILKRHFAVCFLKPKALRQLSRAVNIANVRATFRCEFCCFATTTSFMLTKHKSSHFSRIQNGLVECSHCDLTFFTMAECKKHMNEQSDLYETKSTEDNISLNTASSDNEKWPSSHIMHNNASNSTELNGLYLCWCGVFQSASRSQYLHHLKRIHSINFDSFEDINENDKTTEEETKTENGEATEEFGCPMPDCSFQPENEDDFEMHLTQHHELDDDHIEIGVIRDETNRAKIRKLSETIETTDQQQNSGLSDMDLLEDLQKQVTFIEVCAANDEDDLDLSEIDEVIEKSKSLICEWCAYETTDNLHLDFHNRLMHNSNNVYICPQNDCLFQSENQSSFKVHVFVTHQISDIVKNPVNGSWIAQLNGINTEQSNQINVDPNISECLQAVEDDIAQDTNIDTDGNETIRIEIVEDQTDNTTRDDSLKNNVKKSSLLIKCLNKGCDYYSRYDSESIRKHINICSKKPKRFEDTSKSELCEQEKNHCPLKKQENSSEAILSKSDHNMLLQQADLSKPENVTYTCLMCNTVISHRRTLKNHAHIHGREENNFDLIVGFSQFKGDVTLDSIKIQCDSNFIPRESSNVPIYKKAGKALNIGPPFLGYDPNLPVFSCTECNFKTNETEKLDKHKSLHWNAEKDAAYKAKQWFTCEICFYYCFDAVRFQQHEEIHKKHPVSISPKL